MVEPDAGDAALAPEPDSETQARDSGGPTPPPSTPDAALPGTQPDAGCPDRDGDKVCDLADNCPDDANPDQSPDACATVSVSCNGDQLETGEISNSVTLAKMTINGQTDKVVRVKRGEQVTVSVSLSFSDCAAFALAQLFLGVESEPLECQAAPCSSVVSVSLPYEFSFAAPAVTGLHYLLAGLQSSLTPNSCTTSGSIRPDAGSLAAKRVAALCVEN